MSGLDGGRGRRTAQKEEGQLETRSAVPEGRERTTALRLVGGASLSVLLAWGAGEKWLVLPAIGLLIGAVLTILPAMKEQPYSYWVGWAAGSAVAFLVAWVQPSVRQPEVPVAVGLGATAAVLFLLWRTPRP